MTTYMHEVRLMPRQEREYVLAGIMQEEVGQRLSTAIAELLNLPFSARPDASEEEEA